MTVPREELEHGSAHHSFRHWVYVAGRTFGSSQSLAAVQFISEARTSLVETEWRHWFRQSDVIGSGGETSLVEAGKASKKCWPTDVVRARRRLFGSWRKHLTWEAMGSHLPTVGFARGRWNCFYQPWRRSLVKETWWHDVIAGRHDWMRRGDVIYAVYVPTWAQITKDLRQI